MISYKYAERSDKLIKQLDDSKVEKSNFKKIFKDLKLKNDIPKHNILALQRKFVSLETKANNLKNV